MVQRLDRQDFLENYWSPEPGEHVAFVAPTQSGKTHFAFDLLGHTDMTGLRPPVAMAVKPRDPCVSMWGEKLGWKEVADWPPSKKFWEEEPPGYLCWPKHELSLDPASIARTNENLKHQCQRVMLEAYKNGNRIVYADELFTVLSELKLRDETIALLSKGSAMHASLWYALQMPKGIQGESVPGHAWNSPVHLFLAKDSDKRNRDRFAAIGGVDPEQIYSIVSGLKIHNLETANGIKPISEQLYINKRLGSLTVVGV